MSKIIMCIDMDAFFASVEQQANPKLRGKPIAVIGSGGRTVVVTRSYEARKYGVKTGMNVYEAKKTCPRLIFVIGDNQKYTHTCRELKNIYSVYTPDAEIYSVDEAFLDVTTTHHLFGGPEAIGRVIKKAIRDQFGINGTVGIAPNILIAKLACELSKPDGLYWIRPENVPGVLDTLPLTELWGINKGIEKKLNMIGIRTCGDLGRAPVSLLRNKFGIIGETLKLMGLGICERPVVVHEEDPKSIGHSMTLPRDLGHRKDIQAQILKLSDMVGRRARKYLFLGRRVTLTIRYPDFETFTKQMTAPEYTNSTHEIYRHALSILDTIELKNKVRLIGVRLSHLIQDTKQLVLFPEIEKAKSLHRAIDEINDRYGDFKITWGAYLKNLDPPSVIAPAWRPSGVRYTNIKN